MKNLHFGFMKILILSLITFLITTSCDVNEPKKNNQKPEGYQEDIEWPSLADSPWPMNNGNPQNNSRSNESAYILGKIDWVRTDSLDIHSGIVVDLDGTIYVASQPYFFALTPQGNVKWKLKLGYSSITTPIITSNKEIIVSYDSKIYSLSFDGVIKWKLDSNLNGQINIGKNGELYFVVNNTLFEASNGQIIWSLTDPEIRNNGTISPDGKFLYSTGVNYSLIKIDLENCSIVDKIGKYPSFSLPLVDAAGNIYFSSVIENYNNNNPALFCVNSDLKVKWFFSHNEFDWVGGEKIFTTSQTIIDKFGNIIFGGDTVYSVSYKGLLNWKFIPDKPCGPPITDIEQNIYMIKDNGNSFGIIILSKNGIPLLDTPSDYFNGSSSRFSCVLSNSRLIVPTQDKYLYIIK